MINQSTERVNRVVRNIFKYYGKIISNYLIYSQGDNVYGAVDVCDRSQEFKEIVRLE